MASQDKSRDRSITVNVATTEAVAIHQFVGNSKKELSFKKNDRILILKKHASGWGMGKIINGENAGAQGWFPLNYLRESNSDVVDTSDTTNSLDVQTPLPRKDSASTSTEIEGESTHNSSSSIDIEIRTSNSDLLSNSSANILVNSKREHSFKDVVITKAALCEYCQNYIWGMGAQCVHCKDCKKIVHRKCSVRVPNDCFTARASVINPISNWKTVKVIESSKSKNVSNTFIYTAEEDDLHRKIDTLIQNPRPLAQDEEILHFKNNYFTKATEWSNNNKNIPIDVRYSPVVDYNISAIRTTLPVHFPIKFYFPDKIYKIMRCDGKKTLNETLNQLFKPPHTIHLPKDTTKEDFLVKICGLSEYLYKDVPLESLQYIRESLRKNNSIDLALVMRTNDLDYKLNLYEEKCKTLSPEIFNFVSNELPDTSKNNNNNNSVSHLSIFDKFEVKLIYIQNIALNCPAINNDNNFTIYAEGGLYFGGKLLSPIVRSGMHLVEVNKNSGNNLNGNIQVECELPLKTELEVWQIPRGSRMCITLYACRIKNKNMTFKKEDLGAPLGWVSINLVNFKGQFASGRLYKRLWPNEKANPLGTCVDNIKTSNPIIATVEFTTFMKFHPSIISYTPLVHPEEEITLNKYSIPDPPGREDLLMLNRLVGQDPLYQLSDDEKDLLWENRFFLTNKTKALAKVLLSIDYSDPKLVADAIRTLTFWVKLPPHDALELLDSQYSCPEIREYGVKCLYAVSDADLRNYLLQLVQALKYEPYHDSPLAKFLLSRSIHQRSTIGQFFFWHLKSEMHVPEISERYALILESYLRGCGSDCIEELLKQQELIMSLHQIARDVFVNANTTTKRKDLLKKHLFSLDLPTNIINPLNPSITVKNLIIEECKVMDSAKAPLWLVFENADDLGKPIRIMFKSGDDLRQDMLTLQMFRIMDKLWKKTGMDLGMIPYMVLSTGDMQGMIELVPNSRTIASIQKSNGVNGVFKETGLMDWLMQGAWNGTNSSSSNSNSNSGSRDSSANISTGQFVALGIAEKEQCVENFCLSCAAYVVATYVLGIGDRHNDNIMLTVSGHVFHIDFGHFLGNIKTWAGINRERAPFILTPDWAYVMGGKDSDTFKRFVDLSCKAFNILRKNAATFINLFAMMLSTGIPELVYPEDILYLRKAFCLEETDDHQATELFTKLIYESLNTKSTQLNFFFHNLAH